MERGFDYALTHHQLRARHAIRKQQSPEAGVSGEQGEKCTVCGLRQALYNLEGRPDKLHGHRLAAREFWKDPDERKRRRLNPDPDQQDRLCGVCAMKRFLVEAGVTPEDDLSGINPVWAGYGTPVRDLDFADSIPRVPFPSTATIAAQKFLEDVCTKSALAVHREAVVAAWLKAGLPRTGFARSLSRLAALENQTGAGSFLMLDTQHSVFPETLDISIRRAEKQNDKQQAANLRDLQNRVKDLRKEARKSGIDEPNTRIAVIRLDGDHMGRLLLGDPEVIQTTWRDILHPDAISSGPEEKRTGLLHHEKAREAGWPGLLERKRLMGPSLHAFISRSLAVFSHRIVPWVVEREFSGRLIYCGGDDILAMAPADDALYMTARLQQLFSAPYIVDTMPDETAWGWRHPSSGAKHNEELDRRRFLVPLMPEGDRESISLPLMDSSQVEPYALEIENHLQGPADGEILTMLGKGYSLSAGIAYGHFKSPLQGLLRQSKRMLKVWAKDLAGRSAVGLSHFSRNGIKTEFAMRWESREDKTSNALMFRNVVEGFRDGLLPKRLPYKIREYHRLLHELNAERAEGKEDWDALVAGLFRSALGDSGKDAEVSGAALDLWCQGLALALTGDGRRTEPPEGPLQRAADGLLIARMLAGGEEGV